jgi:hypothetical protein
VVIDSTLARPLKSAVPKSSNFKRIGDADGKKIRFYKQERAARSGAGNKIFDCCFYVTNVMEHCARSHQIKRAASDRVAPTSTTAAAARPLGHDPKRIPPLHAIPMGVTLH